MQEKKEGVVRLWTDGCFDLMHFGHANALRQARALGDYLVVGVHSDKEIELHKGPPVMTEEERYKTLAACKWVDEVVQNAPYVTELAVMDKHTCQYCVHGDDIVVDASGHDTYGEVKKANRFKTVPRTSGVSTTDIVGRMLLMTKEHLSASGDLKEDKIKEYQQKGAKSSPYTGVSRFLTTTNKIVEFYGGNRAAKPTDKIIYIDGGFDLFHVGHVDVLKKARDMGDYLIVGLYDDRTVNQIKGSNYPIMNLNERVLSVLSCRYVSEVVISAPYEISEEMIKSMNIHKVVHGTTNDGTVIEGVDPYKIPKKLGLYEAIISPSLVTTSEIVSRIIKNRLKYEERNRKKEAKEIAVLEKQV